MNEHLGLGFCELPDLTIPGLEALEKKLIECAKPPLNIQYNSESAHRADLELARAHGAGLARDWASRR